MFDEVRGLWVVRFTMTSRAAVLEMLDRADEAGINTLLVQVRGRADAFYLSDIEPPAESLRSESGFDPLAFVVEEGHQRGMAVHAWVNTHLVWGPAALPVDASHMVNANPDWLAVPRALAGQLAPVDPADPAYFAALRRYAEDRPETVEGIYSSPSHPAVKDRVSRVWRDLVTRYDLDGIHFDYIRFPSADFDYSIGALERFRVWVLPQLPDVQFRALDEASLTDLFAFVDGLPDMWDEYRRAEITGLVERLYGEVKAIRPSLLVSAAVVADPETAFSDRFQDWATWLRNGSLDVAVPMAYTTQRSRFATQVRAAREAAADRGRVWAGIGSYMNTTDGTLDMIDLARIEDAGGVVLFSYDWAVGEGRGDPDNPFLLRVGRARFDAR